MSHILIWKSSAEECSNSKLGLMGNIKCLLINSGLVQTTWQSLIGKSRTAQSMDGQVVHTKHSWIESECQNSVCSQNLKLLCNLSIAKSLDYHFIQIDNPGIGPVLCPLRQPGIEATDKRRLEKGPLSYLMETCAIPGSECCLSWVCVS